ncbi:MAG TPA: PspC domain-containing protein [Anaerolineaceae bacterium]|nr:PspC domain-containing protein [Anaerolineaceae bacterium]
MENKLYRSTTDKMLAGVCGGLARYLSIEVVLVRLFFVVFTLLGGVGPLIYLVLWLILPEEPGSVHYYPESQPGGEGKFKAKVEQMGDEFVNAVRQPNQKSIRYIGITLVLIGLYFFVKQLNLPWLSWLNNNVLWAVMILLAGVALLVWGIRKGKGNG